MPAKCNKVVTKYERLYGPSEALVFAAEHISLSFRHSAVSRESERAD